MDFIERRLLPLFSWRKIWGWVVTAFGIVLQAIHWGWFSFDVMGRLDVAWRIVESMGGTPALAASALSSWQFSLGLIVVGLAYLVFVGEPEEGVKRHPALPYLAALVFVICLTSMASIAIYGWFELQMREAYAKGASGIPRNDSPSNPRSLSNQRPLYSDAVRSLTPDQQRILIAEGAKYHKELGSVLVTFLSTDGESRAYANEINATLARAAIDVGLGTQLLGDPSNEGVLIQVANKDNPPSEAIKLQQLLTIADIPARFVTIPNSRPGITELFIAPRPIQR